MKEFVRGLKAGIPIGLGYLSVSFTFGIIAISYGFDWWQAVLISMLTVTSAGQFAGIGVMLHPGQYLTMLISQITINIRYSFMSISLSQKLDRTFKGIYRWLLAFLITDEIFAVASMEDKVNRMYFTGLGVIPYVGWTMGTLFGALLGNVLPNGMLQALGLAIYGMFIAIVVPEMKRKSVFFVVLLAILCSCVFYYSKVLSQIPRGLSVSICAMVAALVGAKLFPVEYSANEEEEE